MTVKIGIQPSKYGKTNLRADILLYAALRSNSMEKSQKYNKRRKSITEFRSSYSDNKKYFISTDRKSSWMPVVKYITIAIFFIIFVIAGFLITDALLEISEAPYVAEETTVSESKTEIDEKYFENIVTKSPNEITTENKGSTD
jgi:hypothetical protein